MVELRLRESVWLSFYSKKGKNDNLVYVTESPKGDVLPISTDPDVF